MKKIWPIAALVILAVGAPSAFAKKGKGPKKSGGGGVFSRYDKNANGTLDPTEASAVKAAFSTDPDLKRYDTNGDGKLDDNEIAAIKPAESSGKKKKKK